MSDPILLCVEACDEGPSYDPATGPSAQALALIDNILLELEHAASTEDLASRLIPLITTAAGLQSHNSDFVLAFASIAQSSMENGMDELDGAGCTEAQKKAQSKTIAREDAEGFAAPMASAWAVMMAGGPTAWTAVLAGSTANSLVQSGFAVADAIAFCNSQP